jgi:hypothetical protein
MAILLALVATDDQKNQTLQLRVVILNYWTVQNFCLVNGFL